MPLNKRSQVGNVFVLVLAGIFLFGALIFTFTRSASKGTTSLSKHQASVAAQEILNYAQSIEQAVNRVRRNGCSENEISFENDVVSGYANANAPSDNSCHVFDENGGKATYQAPNDMWLDRAYEGQVSYGNFIFTGNLKIEDIGTTQTELLFYLPYTSDILCNKINNLLNHNFTIPNDNAAGAGLFRGTYTDGTDPEIGDDATELAGKEAFCMQRSSTFNMIVFNLLTR